MYLVGGKNVRGHRNDHAGDVEKGRESSKGKKKERRGVENKDTDAGVGLGKVSKSKGASHAAKVIVISNRGVREGSPRMNKELREVADRFFELLKKRRF